MHFRQGAFVLCGLSVITNPKDITKSEATLWHLNENFLRHQRHCQPHKHN